MICIFPSEDQNYEFLRERPQFLINEEKNMVLEDNEDEFMEYLTTQAQWRIVDKKNGGILCHGNIQDLVFNWFGKASGRIVIEGRIAGQ